MILLLLLSLFTFTRLTNLTLLPIFSDEANYLDWGWRSLHLSHQLFYSLFDAKQPFLMWLFGIGQQLFPDPLWGARFISFLTGLASFLAIYKIATALFDKTTAYYSVLLYIFIPFFIFFDRQALMESSLTAVCLWLFYFLHQFLPKPNLRLAVIIGFLLGIGFFIKTSAAIFLIAFLVIIPFYRSLKLIAFSLISLCFFVLVNLPLFFQKLFWVMLPSNNRYAYTFWEVLMLPIGTWVANFFINLQILFLNLTPLVFIFALISLVVNKKIFPRFYYLWLFIPLCIYSLTARTAGYISFRYLTPFIPLLIFPVAYFLKNRPLLFAFTLTFTILPAFVLIYYPRDYFYLKARITPHSYIQDYVTGLDTGYQVTAIRQKIDSLTAGKPSYLALALHSFNPEAALFTYYRKSKTITPIYLDSHAINPDLISAYDCIYTENPLYFVAKLDDTAGLQKFLTRVTVVTNPFNPDYSTIYMLKTDCPAQKTVGISPVPE